MKVLNILNKILVEEALNDKNVCMQYILKLTLVDFGWSESYVSRPVVWFLSLKLDTGSSILSRPMFADSASASS